MRDEVKCLSPCIDVYTNNDFLSYSHVDNMKLKSTADLREQAEFCDNGCAATFTSLLAFLISEEGSGGCHTITFICSDGEEADSCFLSLTCSHTNTMGPDMLAVAAHYRFHHPAGSWLQVKCGGLVPSRQEKKERKTISFGEKGVIKISM